MKSGDLKNRDDVLILVRSFYQKVQENEMLAPIFLKFITDWDPHIQVITNFWESTLFSSNSYKGNPMAIHMDVDKNIEYSLTQNHFDEWVNLWHQTIESMFEGEKAEMAKQRASNIANIMFIRLYQARN
ncbi:group III truncated hemoglobin [Ekhidna sp.]